MSTTTFIPSSPMAVDSNRILYTASSFARDSLLYLQEIGELKALLPHVSSRADLQSYLCFMVEEGGGSLTYDGRRYSLTPGSCVFIDCRKPYAHSTSQDELWKIKWVHFDGPTMGSIYGKYWERGGQPAFVPTASTFSEMITVWRQLMDTAGSPDYIRDMQINRHLAALISLLMSESWHPEAQKASPKKASMLDVKEWIDRHYAENISLDGLAERFYINKYYLSRMFRRQFGQTVSSYIQVVRITHAKQLLRFSNQTLEEIGETVGITPARYFSKVFRSVEGMAPGIYRKQW